MSIKISRNRTNLKVNTFLFPCGEVGVKLDPLNYKYSEAEGVHQIIARIRSSNDFMELVMAVDALRRLYPNPEIELILPCFNPMKHKLFVYGTLQSGHGNSQRFRRGQSRLIGKAITVEKFLLMDFGGFPGMYDKPKGVKGAELTQVEGELWECDDNVLAGIDMLEGHPHMYRRTPIKVELEDKDEPGEPDIVDCETYIYQGGLHGVPCADGKWPRTHKLQVV